MKTVSVAVSLVNHLNLASGILLAVLLTSSNGCCRPATRTGPPGLPVDRAAAEAFAARINLNDAQAPDRRLIRRAVYRALLEEYAVGQYRDVLYFLEVEPDEPANFDTVYEGFRVRSAAICAYDQSRRLLVDNNTGEEGVRLSLPDADIKITGTSAEADVTDHEGSSVSIYEVRLQKKDGAWAVVDKKTGWIIDFR
ncbi:MAG: hypothetical protein ACYTAN_14240 [Planctomycetota bacterium]|jgi:hypothetical protein